MKQLTLFDDSMFSRFLVTCVDCGETDEVHQDDYYDSHSFYVCENCAANANDLAEYRASENACIVDEPAHQYAFTKNPPKWTDG